MNSLKKRCQTTKGIWITGLKKNKLLIIDCEGTDSINRKEDEREKFEKASSLFCLAITNILIINMWVTDVGRYTASNYGVLKIVFEVNFKLFNNNSYKKIIIILRDFDGRIHNFKKIKNVLLTDIHNIWNEIKKPEIYSDKNLEDYFILEFTSLPNYIYERSNFNNEIDKMKNRFNENDEDYIFSNLNNENIPSDGIGQYIIQLWNEILNEKDLDIPSQREMLANYRCQEIQNNILKKYEKDFDLLLKKSSKENLTNFKSICFNIQNKILFDYDNEVLYYDDKIKLKVKEQLDEKISQKLYSCFLNQAKKLIVQVQEKMRYDLENKLKNFNSGNYFDFAFQIGDKYYDNLLNNLEEKKVYEKWNLLGFTNLFDEIIDNQKEKYLKEKKKLIIEIINKENENIFNNCLEKYEGGDFWKEFNKQYSNNFFLKIFPLYFFLQSSFNFTNEQITNFLTELENEVYNNLFLEIHKKTKDIHSIIINSFKNKFNEEILSNYSQEQINNLYKQLRQTYFHLFEQFKTFKVVKNINQLYDFDLNHSFHEELLKGKVLYKFKNKEEKFSDLLNQGEIILNKKKFDNTIQSILENIMKKKNESIFGNIPYWFIGLLIFFGYNKIFKFIKSGFFIIFLLFIGFYYSMKQLGKEYLIRDKYFDLEFYLMKKIKSIKNIIMKKIFELF